MCGKLRFQILKMKSSPTTFVFVGAIVVLALIGAGRWWSNVSSGSSGAAIVSKNGLHWHATVKLFVNGIKQDLPAGIGLLPTIHLPVHTHDTDNVVHMEFAGMVRERDLRLKELFKNWQKDVGDFGSLEKMRVNGDSQSISLDHEMRDGDTIELYFE